MAAFPDVRFTLLDTKGEMCKAWEQAFEKYISSPEIHQRFSFITDRLNNLKAPENKYDCLVSPANSYGIMDGGAQFDYKPLPFVRLTCH
jgi:hypothetical protein